MKTREHIRSVTGKGKAYRGDNLIAPIRYCFEIFQEYAHARDSKLPTHKDITGEIQTQNGAKLSVSEPLTLELKDGQRVEVMVISGGLHGSWSVNLRQILSKGEIDP